MTTVELNLKDTARPEVKRLERKARNPIPGLNIAARAVTVLLKAHYREKDQTANRLGGERQHYWKAVGNSVNAPKQTAKDTVSVSISHPSILQKIHGGVIRAKTAKALTIPIHRDSYGRRTTVLEDFLKIKLFRVDDVLLGAPGGKLTAYYLLKKSVNQKADPTALPPEKEIERTAGEKFSKWMDGK